jgi:hypothetical protein
MLTKSITTAIATLAAAAVVSGCVCGGSRADTCLSKLYGAARVCGSGSSWSIENLTTDKVVRLTPMDNSSQPDLKSPGPTPAGWALPRHPDDDATALLVPPGGTAEIGGPTHLELDSYATREQSAGTALCNASGACKYLDPTANARSCMAGAAGAVNNVENGGQVDIATISTYVKTAKACKDTVKDMMESESQQSTDELGPIESANERRLVAIDKAMASFTDAFKSNLDNAFKQSYKFNVPEIAGDLVSRIPDM